MWSTSLSARGYALAVAPTSDLAMPFLLVSAFRGLVDSVHAELATAGFPGIRARHGFAMQAIGTGCSSVQLAERLGVSKQAATKTAQALEALGLIERSEVPQDRRTKLLVPTARGRRMLRLSADSFAKQIQDWRQRVGDEAVDVTLHTLSQIGPDPHSQFDLSGWD